MANISTYPLGSPKTDDMLAGTAVNIEQADGTKINVTRNFTVGDVAAFAVNNYTETTVSLTASQVAALQSTPVELIAAPGAGKYIKILELSLFLDYTAPAYTFAQTIDVDYASGQTIATATTAFGQSAADAVFSVGTLFSGIVPADDKVQITTGGAVGGGGGSSMKVKVRYQILSAINF